VETRRYDDPCGVARALAVVGQRWAMLVVRELLLGPKRFRDLLRGLDGMSPNVLSQRLKDLEAAGVVLRSSPGVYGLTDEGAALEPVLVALGRWGRRRPLDQRGPMSPDALLLALRTTFDPVAAGDLSVVIDLRIDGDRVAVTVAGGVLAMARGAASQPVATVGGDVPGVRAMIYRAGTVAAAVASGTVTVDGVR
jgi:DNA-binding HxlR family transcriptional regulator